MASRFATLAQSLLDHIEDGKPYSLSNVRFTRRWLPFFDRSEIGVHPHIVVVPGVMSSTISNRGRLHRTESTVHVYVQAAVDHTQVENVDRLANLAEEVLAQTNSHEPGDIVSVPYGIGPVTFEPVMVDEFLTEQRMFTSRITANYLSVY